MQCWQLLLTSKPTKNKLNGPVGVLGILVYLILLKRIIWYLCNAFTIDVKVPLTVNALQCWFADLT